MGFSLDEGYTPLTIEQMLITDSESVMNNINVQFGTSYTAETFVGTNFYKYFYALIQRLQQSEVKTSEIFLKLQDYFAITNERISRPVVTSPGLIEALENFESDLAPEGYIASVKPMIEADAGKVHICVDVDDSDPDYADIKTEICEIIKNSVVAGAVTQGTETETIVLSNGQSFDFKYALPNRIPVGLRLTTNLSVNNQFAIETPEAQKQKIIDNIEDKYRLGRNFEPQRYFTTVDAPWASDVLLEWTDDVTDGELDVTPTWHDEVYEAEFDDLFEISLALISVVEN